MVIPPIIWKYKQQVFGIQMTIPIGKHPGWDILAGTCAEDHIIVQAVANSMNLNIHIVESDMFLTTTVAHSISTRNPGTI